MISIVMGTYNRRRFLEAALDSIRQEVASLAYEIIVVDGGSSDGSTEWLARQKDVITIVQHNRGEWRGRAIERRSWGYFMNLGFKSAQGKYVCMLSDDCLVVPGAIRNGIALFEEKLLKGDKVGAVAFYWRNWPVQEKYSVGRTLGNNMFVNHGLYLNAALKEVGYVDEDNYSFYHADGDLCLKMLYKGYVCVDSPTSFIEHFAHANPDVRNSNQYGQKSDWLNYLKKWEGIYYHPEKNDIGDWLETTFVDMTATADQFKQADAFKWFVKGKVSSFFTYLIKLAGGGRILE
jgi:GT2 family glycosyltransferase